MAGDYIYTTPGDQDVDNQMLTLKVPGYRSEMWLLCTYNIWMHIFNERGCFLFDRLPQSVSKASENSELSRITFVFETTCSANCTFSFLAVRICDSVKSANRDERSRQRRVCLQGYNQWLNDVVEWWRGRQAKQSYSYLIQKNATSSFTWSFQRTGENSEVGRRLNSFTAACHQGGR